jgi:hypothetical protein
VYLDSVEDVSADLRTAMDDRINQAEAASQTICERCGQPGRIRDTRWIRTLCDKHAAEADTEIQPDDDEDDDEAEELP